MIEYKRVKLSKLHEDPANARLHPDENLADIRASLKEFGQVEPLVVQKTTGKIIGGNGRYKVMRELGWVECDVAYVDVSEKKAAALGIALNRAGERAEWDKEVLRAILADIDDVESELASSLEQLDREIGGEELEEWDNASSYKETGGAPGEKPSQDKQHLMALVDKLRQQKKDNSMVDRDNPHFYLIFVFDSYGERKAWTDANQLEDNRWQSADALYSLTKEASNG